VAARNKQGDVELVNFGLHGSNNLVVDVLICYDHNSNGTVNNRHLKARCKPINISGSRNVLGSK